MEIKSWDNDYIKANRLYLDHYYKANKNNDKISNFRKILRIFKVFGISGLLQKVKNKTVTNVHYSSNLNEEKISPINWKYKKIVVYTAIIGKYDKLEEPLFTSPYCDYIIFTDMEIPKTSVWKKRSFPKDEKYIKLSNYQRAKYFKIFPHKLLAEYDYSIWVDGNISIIGDLTPFVVRMGNKIIAEFKHPSNDCIYDEALSIVSQGKAIGKKVKEQIKFYKNAGFPQHYGLLENSFIIRKHNDVNCIKLMNEWWLQMEEHTWRDQLSLTYVLWKTDLTFDAVMILGPCWRWNPRLRQNEHN